MTYLEYFILTLLSIIYMTDSKLTQIIQTESGPVRGKIMRTGLNNYKYAAFKGIPYAEPPLGYRRFKPPVKKEKWTNILKAYTDGESCIQLDIVFTKKIIGSEDCLFLNVYTPHTSFTKFNQTNLKAVMVWIYGGGFTFGSANQEIYGPDYLLEDDVIVVILNYRLGPFGFLNLNHKNASGNAGLKDQNLALKWVNQNIRYFGGDSKKITIFGQSAGGVSVDLHMLSDMSAGLFTRSISMSGSPLCFYWAFQSQTASALRAFLLGSALGIESEDNEHLLKALYTVPARTIVEKASQTFPLPFRPTIEKSHLPDIFLSKCAIDKYISGEYSKGSHIMGFTSAETKFLNDPKNKLGGLFLAPEHFRGSIMDISSDLFFIAGIDYKQKLLNRHNEHPIYYYRFSFQQEGSDDVGHAEDLAYVFNTSYFKLNLTNPEVLITLKRHVRLFTNFAKYGNPTPKEVEDSLLEVIWPDSGSDGLHLEIGKDLIVGPRPIDALVKGFESFDLSQKRTLSGCF